MIIVSKNFENIALIFSKYINSMIYTVVSNSIFAIQSIVKKVFRIGDA